jgi:hypothetical protein
MFHSLLSEFGPLDVDRFASSHNALLPVFFSEYWCLGSAGMNAFTVSWHGVSSYCFSPPAFGVPDTAARSRVQGAHGSDRARLEGATLVAPADSEPGPLTGRPRSGSVAACLLDRVRYDRVDHPRPRSLDEAIRTATCLLSRLISRLVSFLSFDCLQMFFCSEPRTSKHKASWFPILRSLCWQQSFARAPGLVARSFDKFDSYSGPWAHFKDWCRSKNVSFLPAAPLTVSLYLTKLMRTASSPSPVLTCSGAIFLHYQLAGLPSPTQHPLVAMTREFARRSKVAGRNVKRPLLASHIRRLFKLWFYAPGSSLHDWMRLTAVVLAYVGFLRFSDLMVIQWNEIRFFDTHMELFLKKTKTDQVREGRWVLCARMGGRFCPVALVEQLLRAGDYAAHGPGPLIPNVSVSPTRQYLRDRQPAYSTVLDWFKGGAQELGLNPDEYGTHSGRRSGATRAANVDIPDRLFKEHGSWKSERAP